MEKVSARPTRAIFRSERQQAQAPTPVFDRGRIRIGESDAVELFSTLALRVEALLDTRGELIDAGFEIAEYYNRKVAVHRRAMGEIERTAREKGWRGAMALIAQYNEVASEA